MRVSRCWCARGAEVSRVREGVKYRMLHSASDPHGNAGVQMWLRRALFV